MFQTVFGSAMLFFGLLLLIFNQRLAQASLDFRKWAFGIKPFIPGVGACRDHPPGSVLRNIWFAICAAPDNHLVVLSMYRVGPS